MSAQGQRQDFTLTLNWRDLDPERPPGASGIYAITSECSTRWYYIGRAERIARRIASPYHPFRITHGLRLGLRCIYLRASVADTYWLERYLIRIHQPEWNGGTEWARSGVNYPYCRATVAPSKSERVAIEADERAALAMVAG